MSAIPYIRQHKMLADIGTDHAYLPIYLCENGILSHPRGANGYLAIASDINEGPVKRASLHIRTAKMSDKILAVRTDGLSGIEKYSPKDIIIFGMGGELISSILNAAPWICCSDTRLILQPMTHAEKLCQTLKSLGFYIVENMYSEEGDRIYRTICADYFPKKAIENDDTDIEMILGNIQQIRGIGGKQYSIYLKFAEKLRITTLACHHAKFSAGVDTSDDDKLLGELQQLLANS